MQDNTKLLSPREIAEAIRARGVEVDDSTVRRWLDSGTLQGIRVVGRWYCKPAVLEAFLASMGVTDGDLRTEVPGDVE